MKERPRSRLMWLFVALALLFDFLMPPLLDWIDFLSFEKEIQMVFFFAGAVAGQCCFVALLSGFAKRTWFGAYLFGLGLAAAGYGAVLRIFVSERVRSRLCRKHCPTSSLVARSGESAVHLPAVLWLATGEPRRDSIGRSTMAIGRHLFDRRSHRDFPCLPVLLNLNLSDTKANDAAMPSIAKLAALTSLSLRNTKITNASLSELSRMKSLYHLDLSDTAIDDEGVRVLGHSTSLYTIDLSCTRVTGVGFTNWQARSGALDLILDRTLIDDQGVASLRSIGAFGELSLAHTAITDACLPHLAQIAITDLDIRDTKITFNGLITSGMPSVSKLHIATGQFTPAQVSQLKKQLGMKVLVDSP
jgi:hypothetical protein